MKFVLLIRGINVGGVVLKMDDLRATLDRLGLTNVRTYIQSGNAVFDSRKSDAEQLADDIRSSIRNDAGLDVAVMVKGKADFKKAAASHPFEKKGNEDRLFITILEHVPTGGQKVLSQVKSASEKFSIKGDIIYSSYSEGYSRSKYNNNYLEKIFAMSATTRNWRTMRKLLQMLDDDDQR
ncbi:MAG: DUF1697 domain-containing protein [Spirochaetota bacterium]